MQGSPQVAKALAILADIRGKEFKSKESFAAIVYDLREYPEREVLASIERCRKELSYFPSVAEIIARIPTNHAFPGPDEAWSLIPTREEQSTFWLDEIAIAYGQVRELLERDEVAARMAFKEVYARLVTEALSVGRKPKWIPSFGTDPAMRKAAVDVAVQRKRITAADAQSLLPAPIVDSTIKQLTSDQDLKPVNVKAQLDEIRKRIGVKE